MRVNKNMATIETILFDMGNVLLDFSHERLCRQVGELCGLSAVEVCRLLFDSGLEAEFEQGRVTDRELHDRFERESQRSIEFESLLHAVSDIFEAKAEMFPLIEALDERGYRLVLLSNTNCAHFRHVRKNFEVLGRFDAFVLSHEVGAMKPAAAIFAAAVAVAGCPPEQCFYTDDIPEYVAAGRAYGLDAEVFTTAAALRKQLQQRGVLQEPGP
ncbi:MAG: HAD family phosphatase [Planctomycetaceae bacterium]|nr:HAD family phosphatase [Planctomycetaceae bacterium]